MAEEICWEILEAFEEDSWVCAYCGKGYGSRGARNQCEDACAVEAGDTRADED